MWQTTQYSITCFVEICMCRGSSILTVSLWIAIFISLLVKSFLFFSFRLFIVIRFLEIFKLIKMCPLHGTRLYVFLFYLLQGRTTKMSNRLANLTLSGVLMVWDLLAWPPSTPNLTIYKFCKLMPGQVIFASLDGFLSFCHQNVTHLANAVHELTKPNWTPSSCHFE